MFDCFAAETSYPLYQLILRFLPPRVLRPSSLRRPPVVPDLERLTVVQRGLVGYEPR